MVDLSVAGADWTIVGGTTGGRRPDVSSVRLTGADAGGEVAFRFEGLEGGGVESGGWVE